MKYINVGYGNIVSADRIVSVASPESAPIKRLVSEAREAGRAIDLSCGKKCRSVIVCDTDHIVISALSTDVILSRLTDGSDEENDEEE
mgnify:CR=1 FL=1